MARLPRKLADDGIYHVINRGNGKMKLFHKAGDYASFIKVLEEGRRRTGIRVLGYCLMGNHWHLVLWPRRGSDLSKFIGWVSTTHVRRWHMHHGGVGEGHVYQGRFKSFIVQDDQHFLTLMRYVESNPLRAKMVEQAQDWRWSSLTGTPGADDMRLELTPWPVLRPDDWLQMINQDVEEKTLARIQLSLKRDRPFGDDKWVEQTAKRLGLTSTLRDRGRPRKSPAPAIATPRLQKRIKK